LADVTKHSFNKCYECEVLDTFGCLHGSFTVGLAASSGSNVALHYVTIALFRMKPNALVSITAFVTEARIAKREMLLPVENYDHQTFYLETSSLISRAFSATQV